MKPIAEKIDIISKHRQSENGAKLEHDEKVELGAGVIQKLKRLNSPFELFIFSIISFFLN